MQKSAKGQITLMNIPETVTYTLRPSVSSITVKTDGTLSETGAVSCNGYKCTSSGALIEISERYSISYCYYRTTGTNTWYYGLPSTPLTLSKLSTPYDYTKIKFRLYVQSVSADPVAEAEIAVFDSRFIDTKFQIWVGTAETPSATVDPEKTWIEENTRNEHIGDYYISPSMRYYVYKYDTTHNPQYYWNEVTDDTLKNILDRTTEKTQGFFITKTGNDAEADFKKYFEELGRRYYTGSLAWYGTNPNDPTTSIMYVAWKDEIDDQVKFSDWKKGSYLEDKFKEAGIEITDKLSINVVADTIRFYNTETALKNDIGKVSDLRSGTMLLSMGTDSDGNAYPRINTSLIEFNNDVIINGDAKIRGWYIEDGMLYHPNATYQEGGDPMIGGGYRPIVETQVSGIGLSTLKNKYAFWAGDHVYETGVTYHGTTANVSPYPFSVTHDGKLTANNAIITGNITANSLTLGTNVTISASNIDGIDTVINDYMSTMGWTNENSPVIVKDSFSTSYTLYNNQNEILGIYESLPTLISSDVSYYKETVTIDDKQISETIMYPNGKLVLTNVGLGVNAEGSSNTSDTYFEVSTNGLLRANNAIINGTVYANAGKIGGWDISDGGIQAISTKANSAYDKADNASSKITTVESLVNSRITNITPNGVYTGEVKAEQIGSQTQGVDAGFNLYSADQTTTKTILAHTTNDWRFTVGENFGVDKSGILYAKDVVFAQKTQLVDNSNTMLINEDTRYLVIWISKGNLNPSFISFDFPDQNLYVGKTITIKKIQPSSIQIQMQISGNSTLHSSGKFYVSVFDKNKPTKYGTSDTIETNETNSVTFTLVKTTDDYDDCGKPMYCWIRV